MIQFDKILISSCFLGAHVRYNGKIKSLENNQLDQWLKQGRLVSICPEVISGLKVPRAAAEINQITNRVVTVDKCDVTSEFEKGAQKALDVCKQYEIRYALLKESSPSCGSNTIYDGTFRQIKIEGEGLTTRLLRKHGIQVFSENSIEELAQAIDQ